MGTRTAGGFAGQASPQGPGVTYTEQAVDDARGSLGRVRVAWRWVTEARIPGPPGVPVNRPVNPRRAADQAAAERVARTDQLTAAGWAGLKPGGTHPTPVMLGPVQVRQTIARELSNLAARMRAHADRDGLVLLVRDPADRVPFARCTWCNGAGVVIQPDGWLWLWPPDPIGCPRCRGRGRIPTGDTCQTCGAMGPCVCDRADATVTAALTTVAGLLDTANSEAAGDADTTLLELAEIAERCVGCGPDRRRLPEAPECPVCGSREMYAEVTSEDRREWVIRCTGPDCVCHGPICLCGTCQALPRGRRGACPCGVATPRRAGRRHVWPSRLWDGPNGLAAILGINLPGTYTTATPTSVRTAAAVGVPTITT